MSQSEIALVGVASSEDPSWKESFSCWMAFSVESEILRLETALVLEDNAFSDLVVNILLFVDEGGELFHLDAVALGLNPLVEGKVSSMHTMITVIVTASIFQMLSFN